MHLHLNDLKKHHKSMHVFNVCRKASAQDVNLRKHLEVCRFLSLSFSTHQFILLRKFDPSWCSPLLLHHHFQTQKRDSALFPPSLHRLQLGILLLLLQPFHFNYSLPEEDGPLLPSQERLAKSPFLFLREPFWGEKKTFEVVPPPLPAACKSG